MLHCALLPAAELARVALAPAATLGVVVTIAATRATIERIRRLAISHGFVADVGCLSQVPVLVRAKSFRLQAFFGGACEKPHSDLAGDFRARVCDFGATPVRLQRFFSGRVAVATGDSRAVQPQAVSEAGGANNLGNQHSQVVNSTKNTRLSLDIRLDFIFLVLFFFLRCPRAV